MTAGVEAEHPATSNNTNKNEHVGEGSATVYEMKRLRLISNNVFLVIATATVNRIARINRNMVVLRHNKHRGELTLINPIRLDEAGEQRLLRLGKSIERIIRLAPRHGLRHDQYYLKKFPQVRRWAPASSPTAHLSSPNNHKEDSNALNNSHHHQLPVHRLLAAEDNTTAILPACHVFCFQETVEPECALVLLSDYVGNVLVTAEALQCHGGAQINPYINMPVRVQLAARGMTTRPVVIPPRWVQRQMSNSSSLATTSTTATSTPLPFTASSSSSSSSSMREQKRAALRWDFEMLLRLDFDRLVGASGLLLLQEAKEQAVMAVEQTFPLM